MAFNIALATFWIINFILDICLKKWGWVPVDLGFAVFYIAQCFEEKEASKEDR